jgi:hypothetical protein
MAQTNISANQFEMAAIIGQLDLDTNPTPFIDTVRYNPNASASAYIYEAEGVALKDLSTHDVNASGVPVVDKRTTTYGRLFGIKVFNIKKNKNSPGDTFDIAGAGAVMFLQCGEAIARGDKVALDIANVGKVIKVATGYAEAGVALDQGSTGDVIRVKLTMDDTAVAAT